MPSFPKITNQKSTFIIGIHGSVGKDPSCNAGDSGDAGLILGLGRSPGEGNGNPLQYPCLENPMDQGAWWAAVHRVTELDTTDHARTHRFFLHPKALLGLPSAVVR